jgi:hypothetical protein
VRHASGNERFDLLRVASESAIRTEEGSEEAARRTRRPASDRPRRRRRGATAAVKEHLDARIASAGRYAERASAALPQRRQHALDVLACPKAIGSMVEEAADFHLVDATATGAHAERAENRPGSIGSTAKISVRPRQRRSATSSSSVVLQP